MNELSIAVFNLTSIVVNYYLDSHEEEITTEINNKISDAKEQLPRRIVVTVDDNGNATFSLSNLPVA